MQNLEKSPFIKGKIAELRAKLVRPCTEFETGGFRPSGGRDESWIGRVFLCRPDEAKPVADANGKPLYALAQFYLPALPFVPEPLRHITWLTVFMGEDFPEIKGQYGIEKLDENGEAYWQMCCELGQNNDGWLIREYTAADELVEYEFEPHEWLSAFLLRPVYQSQDFPLWDGGGVPFEVEREICELDNFGDEDNPDKLNYHADIATTHSSRHKFGGYPSFCQSGVDFGEGFEFMFQISSDAKAGLNVIDGGSLMFARDKQGK